MKNQSSVGFSSSCDNNVFQVSAVAQNQNKDNLVSSSYQPISLDFPLLFPDAPKQGGATSGFHTIFKTGFLKDLRLLQNKEGGCRIPVKSPIPRGK